MELYVGLMTGIIGFVGSSFVDRVLENRWEPDPLNQAPLSVEQQQQEIWDRRRRGVE
jgi:hypothetical protein